MLPENNFVVLNIREYLKDDNLGEECLRQILSEFSCPLNPDVERFLKEQSIEFAKKHQAVTYLLFSTDDATLLGYFSITIKPLVVNGEPFSNTIKRKLARFSDLNYSEHFNLAAYLIAQLGKNFSEEAQERISGRELLEAAMTQARLLQYQVGGMVSFVEAENNEKVLSFYKNYGYKRFATRVASSKGDSHKLIQLLKLIKNYKER